MAHFLGPMGAAKVLMAKDTNADQPAASLVPKAAHKNRSVFYDHNRSPRSVAAVYDRIHHAIERPMQQYAKMDNAAESTAYGHRKGQTPDTTTATSNVTTVASNAASPDAAWPFETGQWPPPLPVFNPAAIGQDDSAATPSDSKIASGSIPPSLVTSYLSKDETAHPEGVDRISAPMPEPLEGLSSISTRDMAPLKPLSQLFTNVKKGLFG